MFLSEPGYALQAPKKTHNTKIFLLFNLKDTENNSVTWYNLPWNIKRQQTKTGQTQTWKKFSLVSLVSLLLPLKTDDFVGRPLVWKWHSCHCVFSKNTKKQQLCDLTWCRGVIFCTTNSASDVMLSSELYFPSLSDMKLSKVSASFRSRSVMPMKFPACSMELRMISSRCSEANKCWGSTKWGD